MPKTVQIRDVADDVYAALSRHAAQAGLTVPELLRREMVRLARRPTLEDWLARTARRPSDIGRDEVLDALDEVRGEWPGAGG
jgi:antitoxin FitA